MSLSPGISKFYFSAINAMIVAPMYGMLVQNATSKYRSSIELHLKARHARITGEVGSFFRSQWAIMLARAV